MNYFLSVIGMVFIVEAVPYILFPGKVKTFAQFVHAVPDSKLQAAGIIAAFAGLLIIYLGRQVIGM
jgi:uncharacterized protein